MRENAFINAERYLLSGRLTAERVVGDVVLASVIGDEGDVYRVEWDRQRREWSCSARQSGRGAVTCSASPG